MKKLALGTAIIAMSVPVLANAAQYEKSIVLDERGNPVKSLEGVCVTHDFPEVNNVDCKATDFAPNIVYFELGSSALNAKGKKVLDQVASSVKNDGSYTVTLTGHADRLASASFNQALSERRVSAVKKGLVARGLDAENINTVAEGEARNAVPTADGVPNKLNRRVEIEINN